MTTTFTEIDETIKTVNVIDMFHAIEERQVSFLAFCEWLEEIRELALEYSK